MTSPFSPSRTNEETYEELISLIENSQGRLAPIIVACDDWALRQRVIDRYEAEARQANILPYRVELGREPSVRAALANLKETNAALQQGRPAVFTITGADTLLRVTLKPEDEQSELDKFFGYLQWTREGLREFRYPIVLWVSHRILKEISRRAPDFWSWRKAVLRFRAETKATVNEGITVDSGTFNADQLAVGKGRSPLAIQHNEPRNDFLPPLEELQAEIQRLESTAPDSPNLATLYDQLGRVYADRVTTGKAADLDQERQAAIASFQTAINRYQQLDRKSAQAAALNQLGNFLYSQSRFRDAIDFHQQHLSIAREIGDRRGEANALSNLGIAYFSLGQYQQTIDFYRQSLAIDREIGDQQGEVIALSNLGIAYFSLGQYQRAIDFYQQSLTIERGIGNRRGEAYALGNLGLAYNSLGQYPQAIDFHQRHLNIAREIGDRQGEAYALGNLGLAYFSLGQYQEALEKIQQAKQLFFEIELDYKVEQCDQFINKIRQSMAVKPHPQE
ncbi:tetratricopeptide repeat protein [Leptolyngbya sp. FACHB-671]|uniref:tetratricopeptide repeat protein n=1 Tax=Leptolyngbya sp. FACHB-671 TaxID=2692812 RepID=UPI0016854DE3|nr:tetratricopeptide repeat protein [Leptolyngbya sp. FACHB-671]MBD2069574.1 tetratricopeptide repeat protein [Leptolyngbya sp. FACHB-671]